MRFLQRYLLSLRTTDPSLSLLLEEESSYSNLGEFLLFSSLDGITYNYNKFMQSFFTYSSCDAHKLIFIKLVHL